MRERVASSFTVRVATLLLISALGAVAGCNDDGRELRPPRPNQNASVSVPSTSTTVLDAPGFGTADIGIGDIDTGPIDTSPIDTSPFPSSPNESALVLTGPFADGAAIDARFTCDGDNVSPELNWTPAPVGTIEIAISMVDLDAPSFVHWTMAGLDPLATSLGEAVVPEFAIVGLNGSGNPGYTGPCPPSGEHRYEISVHFLAQQTELADGSPGTQLLAAIEGSTFAAAQLTGTYSRSGA